MRRGPIILGALVGFALWGCYVAWAFLHALAPPF